MCLSRTFFWFNFRYTQTWNYSFTLKSMYYLYDKFDVLWKANWCISSVFVHMYVTHWTKLYFYSMYIQEGDEINWNTTIKKTHILFTPNCMMQTCCLRASLFGSFRVEIIVEIHIAHIHMMYLASEWEISKRSISLIVSSQMQESKIEFTLLVAQYTFNHNTKTYYGTQWRAEKHKLQARQWSGSKYLWLHYLLYITLI